jgi:hypothetical protein
LSPFLAQNPATPWQPNLLSSTLMPPSVVQPQNLLTQNYLTSALVTQQQFAPTQPVTTFIAAPQPALPMKSQEVQKQIFLFIFESVRFLLSLSLIRSIPTGAPTHKRQNKWQRR